MKKGDYYKWKAGEKMPYKYPWVIDCYKSVTDENQYDKHCIVTRKATIAMGVVCFLFGLCIGLGVYFFY